MIGTLHKWGVKSNLMYTAGIVSVGLAFASWAASNRLESAGVERADRWGIFVGEWAPTFLAIGMALRMEELQDEDMEAPADRRGSMDGRATDRTPASAVMS